MLKKTLLIAGLAVAIATAPAVSADKKKSNKNAAPAQEKVAEPVKLSPIPMDLKTKDDSVSYAIGVNNAKGLQNFIDQNGLKLDPQIITKAMETVLSGHQSQLTDDREREILTAFQQEMQAKASEKQAKEMEIQKQQAGENQKKADAFLAENKSKEGVIVTQSGLQYKVIVNGTGAKPKSTDQVKVHYKGTLIDGSVFDSSIDRGEPITFPVTGVIPGWVEALQLMNKGSKWMLFIPPALAYGERSPSPSIPPNSLLIFEVELLDVISAEQPKK